jgi:hypothetical protein
VEPNCDPNLIASIARLEGKIDGQGVRLDAHLSRTRDELDALFRVRKEHEARITGVEKTYVPRDTFDKHESQQREDTQALGRSIEQVKTQVTKIMAIGGAIWALIGLAVGIWSKL